MKNQAARTFFASLLTYVLLTSQMAPMAFALNAARAAAPPKAEAKGPELASETSEGANVSFAPVPVPLRIAPAAVAPIISATKTDSFADSDGDGKAEPGETITYSITIQNTGPDPATNVTLNDTVDPNTNIVGGSTHATPIGVGDAFNVLGNVRIQVPDGASDLLANDVDPDTGTNAGLTITTLAGDNSAPFAGNSANSGQVTAATGNGSFEYNPPPGFTGIDTFTYIVSDSDGNSQAVTVTLTITGTIWFVNSAAAAGGDGRLTAPFNCYTGTNSPGVQTCLSATAADDPGDIIFLYSGSYIGGNVLLNNQRLVGQGATDTLANVGGVTVPTFSDALPTTGGSSPTITTSVAATNAIPLGQGNLLRGFTVGNTTGAKIFGNNFGTLTVGNNATPDVILNGSGQALNLTTGTLSVSGGFASVATTSSGTQGIVFAGVADSDGAGGSAFSFGSTTVSGATSVGIAIGTTTADLNLGNTSVTGGTDAIALTNNSGGTRTFGTVTTSGNSGIGFAHTAAGGITTVTGATTITNPGGSGISIQNSTTAISFAATSVNKGASAGTGVDLGNNSGNTTFNSLGITTSNGTGLFGVGNTGQINVTINAGNIASTNGPAINITKAAAPATPVTLNFTSVSSTNSLTTGLTLDRVSGNAAILTTTTTNPTGIGISVTNTSVGGTMNFGNTTSNTSAGAGVNLGSNAGAVTFADLDIAPDPAVAAFVLANSTGTTTSTTGTISTTDAPAVSVTNSPLAMTLTSVSADNTGDPDSCVNLTTATGTITMQGGTLTGGSGAAFLINGGTVASTYNGTITQNTGGARAIDVQNKTGGISAFGGLVTASTTTGNAIHLVSNAGATVNFTAGMSLTTTSGVGFNATGGGTVNATQDNVTILNTVSTSTGIGVNIITPTNIGGSGVTFRSVAVNGAPSGIVLNGTTGAFQVAGDGSTTTGVLDRDGSGGNLTNTTDDAVRLTNASNVTIRQMNLNSPGDTVFPNLADNESSTGEHGVEAIGGGNIIVSAVLITGPSASGMIAINLTGTNRLNDNSLVTAVNNGATHGLFISNTNTNMTLFEVNNTDFTSSTTPSSVLNVKQGGTSTFTVEVENGCIFEALSSQAVTMDSGATAGTTGTLTTAVTNNIFRNATGLAENNAAALVANGATHNATISGNTFENIAKDGTIANTSIIRTQNTGGKMTAIVSNNLIQNIAYAAGQGGRHVIGHVFEPAAFTAGNFSNLRFEGNTATNITYNLTNREFIFIDYRPFAGGGDIKILGNNWNMPTSAATSEAIDINFRQANVVATRLQIDNNGQGTGATSNTGTRFLRIDVEDAAQAQLTVTNNKFTNPNATPGTAIDFSTLDPAAPGGPPSACVNVSGNNLAAAGNTIRLNEAAGNMTVTQTSSANVAAVNGGAAVTVVGTPTFAQPPCGLPTNIVIEADTAPAPPAPEQPQVVAAQTSVASDSITSRPFVSSPRPETKAPEAKAVETKINPFVGVTSGVDGQKVGADKSADRKQEKPNPTTNINPTPPVIMGDNITWNIGTLPAGQSVTITFQVTVDDPYSGPANVSNQGTVTADGGISVPTDDPAVMGTNNPTLTPIDVPVDIFVKDAKVAEPTSGSVNMVFTVILSAPATGPVSVNFTTADEPAGPGKAVAGSDYTTTSGTANFTAGQQVKTINVPVLADADGTEPDETFLVNLSGPVNGIISDGQAVGTITAANTPGVTLISELRTSGPSGTNDDFVEIYNNSTSSLTVAASDASAGYGLFKSGAAAGDTPVLIGTIPNGTVIPARGHYLMVGSAYSLTANAASNLVMTADIENDRNVGLFSTANIANISSTNLLDAVGFGLNTGGAFDLLREGSTLGAATGSTAQHSFVRNMITGFPQDTNNNAADFVIITTDTSVPVGTNAQPLLGGPGPENLASPLQRSATIKASLVDPAASSNVSPNRIRDTNPYIDTLTPSAPNGGTPATNPYTLGTLLIRRKFTNNTGGPVTRLRFRVVDVTTTFSQPPGQADVRALTSATQPSVTITGGGTIVVNGLTLDQPPTQARGGGLNSSLAAGTVTIGTPLAAGGTINVNFLLGVATGGSYKFFIIVEALP